MILIYPLVISKTVNSNIIPGVCKAIEKHITVYKLDDAIDTANKGMKRAGGKGKIKRKGKKLVLESFDYLEEVDPDFDYGPSGKDDKIIIPPPDKVKEPTSSAFKSSKKGSSSSSRDDSRDDGKPAYKETVKINAPKSDHINSEPTYIEITTPSGTQMIGIKVVPFIIENDQSLIKLMTEDRYRDKLNTVTHFWTRRILTNMFKVANQIWKYSIGLAAGWTGLTGKDMKSGTITGDWKHDIILGRTNFKEKPIVMVNQIDLKSSFLSHAGGVSKLFKLGWSSFVVVDDVNKRVSFCMKEYKGMCSMLNYDYLYSNISRQASDAFKDIEDVKRSSGPLFRINRRIKKVATENNKMLEDKLNTFTKDNLLNENTNNMLKMQLKNVKVTPEKSDAAFKMIYNAAKTKNVSKLTQLTKNLFSKPSKLKDLEKIAKSEMKKFDSSYNLAINVLTNSLSADKAREDVIKSAAFTLTVFSRLSKDSDKVLKNSLKKVVSETRKAFKAKDTQEWDKDVLVAFTLVVISSAIGSVAVAFVVTALIPIVGKIAKLALSLALLALGGFLVTALISD